LESAGHVLFDVIDETHQEDFTELTTGGTVSAAGERASSREGTGVSTSKYTSPAALRSGMAVPFVDSLVAFVIALLIGGLAIYVSARLVAGVDDYGHAVVTALVGAVAWALTSWIPLLGPLIALVVWVGVINWRYPGGWVRAGIIGFGAWISALVILLVLNSVLDLGIGAFGVPGV